MSSQITSKFKTKLTSNKFYHWFIFKDLYFLSQIYFKTFLACNKFKIIWACILTNAFIIDTHDLHIGLVAGCLQTSIQFAKRFHFVSSYLVPSLRRRYRYHCYFIDEQIESERD